MEEKLYIIKTAKKIHCLNHITGPVLDPTPMDPIDVLGLVRKGFDVYEVNPYNKQERVKVTPYNFNSIRFKTTQSEMIKRKRLNRELQEMAKKEVKNPNLPRKKEEKKEDKKKDSEVKVEETTTAQSLSHTDFEKH